MSLDHEKEGILKIVFAFSLVLFLSFNFSLAQTSGCCIFETGVCSSGYTSEECTSVEGIYSSASCSSLDSCTRVCCESGTSTWAMMGRDECQINGGTEHPELDSSSCSGCTGGNTYVTGYVKYQDGSYASSARVNFFSAGSTIKSVSVNSEGVFNACVPKNTNYNVVFQNPLIVSCNLQDTIGVGDSPYDTGEVILPCLSSGAECLTVWDVGEWEYPDEQCGTRTVEDTGNCNPPTESNKPVGYIPCIISETTCRNNQLDSGEECDPTVSNIPGGNTCPSGSVGSITCSENCKILRNCFNCNGPFTDFAMCACPAYSSSANCATGCSSSSRINSFTVAPTYENGNKGVQLDWEIPSQCSVRYIMVERCDGNNAVNPTTCNTTSNGNAVNIVTKNVGSVISYLDFPTCPNFANSFCYNISVIVSGGSSGDFVLNSEKKCTALYDDLCINHPNGGYCSGKNYILCQDGKFQSEEECECGCRDETDSAPAACVGDAGFCNVCDVCSGPFGTYGYTPKSEGYNLIDNLNGYVAYQNCGDLLYDQFCYVDDYSRNKAVIGQYHSCFNVSSCYDYRTKYSCDQNPCGILASDDCRWVSLSPGNEIGLGLCIPANPDEQDCTKCGQINILGKYCSPALCSLFGRDESGGTTCYYNKKITYRNLRIDNTVCMNIEDVACETYDDEDSCVGDSAFSLDVSYDSENYRIGGDNSYSSSSDDLLGYGKCLWSDEIGCFRNADDDPVLEKDCTSSNLNLREKCLSDFINPETTIIIMGEEAQNEGRYSVDELKSLSFATSEQVLNTYYSISSSGYEYPTGKYSSRPGTDRTRFLNELSSLTEGSYTIYFYSEDTAHNLEAVRSLTFSIIPDLSGISIETTKISGYDSVVDMFVTNLSVEINYDEDELDCSTVLRNEANPSRVITGDARKISPYLNWNYLYLLDGTYTLNVACSDTHNQKYENSLIIIVDADMSINGAYPKGRTFRAGNVNIGVDTNDSATCFYTDIGGLSPSGSPENLGGSWERYSTTGGRNHTSTINEPDVSGIRYYYSACYFPSQEKWFTGNNGDIIFYAIDESAPSISIYDESTGGLYNGLDTIESISLRVVCDDSNSMLVGGKDFAFGCGAGSIVTRVYYQNYPDKIRNLPAADVNTFDGEEGYIEVLAPDSYIKTLLDITVRDNGGNTRTQTLSLGNLRNLSFMRPIITICNPETGLCI